MKKDKQIQRRNDRRNKHKRRSFESGNGTGKIKGSVNREPRRG
jgi:hypothetical protein